MKKSVSPVAIGVTLALVAVVVVGFAYRSIFAAPPAPGDDGPLPTRADMMRQRNAPPPANEPPMPTYQGRRGG